MCLQKCDVPSTTLIQMLFRPLGDLDLEFGGRAKSLRGGGDGNDRDVAISSNDPSADITNSLFGGWCSSGSTGGLLYKTEGYIAAKVIEVEKSLVREVDCGSIFRLTSDGTVGGVVWTFGKVALEVVTLRCKYSKKTNTNLGVANITRRIKIDSIAECFGAASFKGIF